ncbi:MAG: biopolymer transporter ExbD [bacterium]|nr:biopolymer transporter ExbD [bacterium]
MRHELRPISEMNITSLADISITILIIFIVTGTFLKSGINVNIPRTSAATAQKEEGIVVSITKEGRIFVEETQVSLSYFEKVLEAKISRARYPLVYLKADEGVPYGLVMEVIGRIKEIGIENLSLIAEPKRKGTVSK